MVQILTGTHSIVQTFLLHLSLDDYHKIAYVLISGINFSILKVSSLFHIFLLAKMAGGLMIDSRIE